MTLIEILNNVDPTHRVKYTGWESDFGEVDWPTMMEFSIKTVGIDSTTNTAFVYFKEVDDCSFELELIKCWWEELFENYNDVKFFFNEIELKPSFGDVGHSDKITHIDFEPIK